MCFDEGRLLLTGLLTLHYYFLFSDWDSALQSAWEQQLQRREEQLDRSSSKWEDFMRKSTEDLAKVDEQKRMKAMLAQLFGMSTEDFVNDSNSNSVSVISATESESLADSTKTSDELVTQSKTSLIGQNNEESQLPVGIAAAAEEIMSSSADSAFADISSNEESLQSLLETTGRTPEQQQVSAAYKVLDNLGELINLRDSKNIGWSDDDPTVQNYAKSVTELNKAQKAVDVALAEQEENRKSAIGAVTARKTSLRSKLLEKMKSKKLLSPESVDKPALEPEELKEILLDAAALDKLNQQR